MITNLLLNSGLAKDRHPSFFLPAALTFSAHTRLWGITSCRTDRMRPTPVFFWPKAERQQARKPSYPGQFNIVLRPFFIATALDLGQAVPKTLL